jgi:hypothetical protein
LVGTPNWRPSGNLLFSEDGQTLYANGLDERMSAIDLTTGDLRYPALRQQVPALNLEVESGVLFSPVYDSNVEWTFDTLTGEPLPVPKALKLDVPSGSHISKDGRRLLLSSPSRVSVVLRPDGVPVGPGFPVGPPSFVYSEFVEGTPWILSAIGPKLEPPSLRLWDSRSGLELGPRWRLGGYGVAGSVTTGDRRHTIISIQGVGYVIVKVEELREMLASPDELPADERFRLMEIRAIQRLENGLPKPFAGDFEWDEAWESFSARHPDYHPLKPEADALLRWHRNQEAYFGPASFTGKWHRTRIEALGER